MIKSQSRIVAFSDGGQRINVSPKCIIGLIYRGSNILEGILYEKVQCTGFNTSERLVKCIKNSPFITQLKLILLDTTMHNGKYLLDLNNIYTSLKIPVVVIHHKPLDEDYLNEYDYKKRSFIQKQLKKMSYFWLTMNSKRLYVYCRGLDKNNLKVMLFRYFKDRKIWIIQSARLIAKELNRSMKTKKINL